MTFWAYTLRCADGSYYVGETDNLDRRIAQHHYGEIPGCTQKWRPVTLDWSETFATRNEAKTVEQQIKGWNRAKKAALIVGDWEAITLLARNRQGTAEARPSTGSRLRL